MQFSQPQTVRISPASRRGMATLEFVMGLPVLLTLAVGMTWLGFSVLGQCEVTVEARHEAFKQRFDDKAKKPLYFPSTPLYPKQQDYVTATVTGEVKVSPMFDKLPKPEASHLVLAGSWDHRAMPLDGPPSWKQYIPAVANAKTAGFQTSIGNIENLANDLASSAGDVLLEQLNLGSQVDNLGGGFDDASSAADDANEAQRQEEKQRLQQKRLELQAEIRATDSQINQLRIDYVNKVAENEPDEEKKEKELDRISQNIDLMKGKRERLRSELRDVEAELSALD